MKHIETSYDLVVCGGGVGGVVTAVTADHFVDATGDGTIAALAGCSYMTGREAKEHFGEILAPDQSDTGIMGASLLFRAREKKEPSAFNMGVYQSCVGHPGSVFLAH